MIQDRHFGIPTARALLSPRESPICIGTSINSILFVAIGVMCSLLISQATQAQKSTVHASIEHEGKIDCFSLEFMAAQTKPPSCEPSAVETLAGRIFFGNDKNISGEGLSAIIWYQKASKSLAGTPDGHVALGPIQKARKWEALAKIHGTSILLASTAFDRIKKGGKWDSYNTLIAWDAATNNRVQIINEVKSNGRPSSLEMRSLFKAALANKDFPKGPDFFKVEAMAVLPDSRILFGIRESGKKYNDFTYQRTILAGKLSGSFPKLTIEGPLQRIFQFVPASEMKLVEPLGISSMAYDPKREGLWILTSYEQSGPPKKIGAYLWFLSKAQLTSETGIPKLVRLSNGNPLDFEHKSEGISVLENGTLLVIHDDDRVTTTQKTKARGESPRGKNQSYFTVVKIH